jgi:hypothetical protein
LERFPNDPSQPASGGFASFVSLEEDMDIIAVPRSKSLRGLPSHATSPIDRFPPVVVTPLPKILSVDRIPPKISEEEPTVTNSPPISPPVPVIVTPQYVKAAQDSGVQEKKKRAGCESSSRQSFTPLPISLWELGKRVWRGEISSSTSVASHYPSPTFATAVSHPPASRPSSRTPNRREF